MKHMIATVLTATVLLLLAVDPVHGMGRTRGTKGRGTPVVIAAQQTFVLSNHQAVIVPRPFLFPQRGFLISAGVAVPSGFVAFRTFRFGPGIGGSGFVGADVAAPYYAYPYPVDAAPHRSISRFLPISRRRSRRRSSATSVGATTFKGMASASHILRPPPRVVVEQPPIYIEQGKPSTLPGYWYYCASAQRYYPDVATCPEAWIRVPPRPN